MKLTFDNEIESLLNRLDALNREHPEYRETAKKMVYHFVQNIFRELFSLGKEV